MAGTVPDHYNVFLSHSGPDKPAVEELAKRLVREGIEPWLDKWNLIPGDPWMPVIEDVLDQCDACAVFIGSGGLGAWQKEEMQAAITRRVSEGRAVADGHKPLRVIPILLPDAERPERSRLPRFLTATTWVEFRSTLEDDQAFRRLVCGIRGEEPGPGPDGAPFVGQGPYRGLEIFDVEHAPFFFGREALTEWLVVALRASSSGQENRFLAILGASGSGKSSLARAGLVAALKRGALDGSSDWPIVILKPGCNPIENLAFALARLPGGAALIKDTRDLLNIQVFGTDQKSLHLFARLALHEAPQSRRLVVLVDQCEEVFTLCKDEAARQALFDNLLYAATVADGQAIVVLTMRADFYGKCGPYSALAAAMSDHQLLVGPLTEDDLRRTIERPTLLAGGEFDPGLIEVLLQDVKGQAGYLPLLEFTLLELWKRRQGRRLTVAAYKDLGGVQGALEKRADEVLKVLKESIDTEQKLCRRIFLRLVQPGEGTADTKRRVSYRDLLGSEGDSQLVEKVIHHLADARLITTEGRVRSPQEKDGYDPESYVEVAHEALIRGWTQLRQWIDTDRDGLRLHRQLTEAAREWESSGRNPGDLYGGTRLAVAHEWAEPNRSELNPLEAEFLAASRAAARRRKQHQRMRVLTSIAAVGVAILAGAYLLYDAQLQAAKQRAQADGLVIALESSEARGVPRILEQLRPFSQSVRTRLEALARADPEAPAHGRRPLRAALALLPEDPARRDELADWLLRADVQPDELIVIRQMLQAYGHAAALTPKFWDLLIVMNTELTDLQVRAAAALASFAAKDPRWQALGTPVATKLVRENPLRIGAWREAFQPISGPLTRPLVALYGDRSRPEERASAYTLLFGFATQPGNPNRPEDLAELVADADPPQFRQIRDQLAGAEDRRRAFARLAPRLDSLARFDDTLARRQGRVAAALVALGYPDRAWPLLRHEGGGDPSVRTELIHNLAKFDADPRAVIPRAVIARFRSEPDVSARRALLLALGEYPIGQIPADERQALTATLRDAYATDPDPGLHSAIDWLLRGQWGQAEELDRNDQQLAGPGLPASRDWYVNTQGLTMAIIRDAGEFLMGSPPDEAGRDADEIQHRVHIGRSFAIATRKVTVAQYARFLDENPDALRIDIQGDVKSYISTPDCPMIKVNWYDAARYCNWLSRQEGIPEGLWCYPEAIRPGMKLPPDYLRRTGYRLPTEAEWEYACRAGSATSRFYGGSEVLLPNFAWFAQNAGKQAHPVGRLKPNDLGLFDMLGNAFDWTQDPYGGPGQAAIAGVGVNIAASNATVQLYGGPYQTGPEARTFPDVEIDVPVSDDTVRLMRGCSFFFPASALRCAGRDALPPSARNYSAGFRPARTIR